MTILKIFRDCKEVEKITYQDDEFDKACEFAASRRKKDKIRNTFSISFEKKEVKYERKDLYSHHC